MVTLNMITYCLMIGYMHSCLATSWFFHRSRLLWSFFKIFIALAIYLLIFSICSFVGSWIYVGNGENCVWMFSAGLLSELFYTLVSLCLIFVKLPCKYYPHATLHTLYSSLLYTRWCYGGMYPAIIHALEIGQETYSQQ